MNTFTRETWSHLRHREDYSDDGIESSETFRDLRLNQSEEYMIVLKRDHGVKGPGWKK